MICGNMTASFLILYDKYFNVFVKFWNLKNSRVSLSFFGSAFV
jgi:hypothetical protein